LLPSYCLQTIICEKLSESFSALFEKMSDSEVISAIENAAEAAMNTYPYTREIKISVSSDKFEI
jgi:hypothetical protein